MVLVATRLEDFFNIYINLFINVYQLIKDMETRALSLCISDLLGRVSFTAGYVNILSRKIITSDLVLTFSP